MRLTGGVLALVLLFTLPAWARTGADNAGVAAAGGGEDTTERLVIHGFGNWMAGLAEKGRSFGIASDEVNARNIDVALNFSAFPVDAIAIHVQPFVDVVAGETSVSLDFGFVSWEPSDRFALRMGKVQQPVGLFSQVFDVGTLRPFATLAQGVYGATGVMSEGYYGVGASGTFASDGGFTLSYDLYGGALDVDLDQTVEEAAKAAGGAPVDESGEGQLNRMVGARLELGTPVPGLVLAVAGYTGNTELGERDRRTVAGGSIEYRSSQVELRAEYFALFGDLREHTAYVEAAYRPIPPLQLAARYDVALMSSIGGAPVPSGMKRHGEASLGVSWWFGRSAAFKLSGHRVDGGRLAHGTADEVMAAIAANEAPEPLHYAVLAASFTF